eukprot:TRINITY_DN3417_c0_g2_i9.p1 TRINITY_DN3417_c0_g2~~TRINITY_DN3417_c0_g2_i9.p1  ORF type:complete len:164 (+),score=42.34 TRINITY_DN3417_c0_g2_i9:24-494(+)
MIRRPPRSTHCISSAASDVYKRQVSTQSTWEAVVSTQSTWAPKPQNPKTPKPQRHAKEPKGDQVINVSRYLGGGLGPRGAKYVLKKLTTTIPRLVMSCLKSVGKRMFTYDTKSVTKLAQHAHLILSMNDIIPNTSDRIWYRLLLSPSSASICFRAG